MNFLAHLRLAGDDEGLMLGALAGDFVKGRRALEVCEPDLRRGILLHRFVDSSVDALPPAAALRRRFAPPFRRYAGLITDLAFDHLLACRWDEYSEQSLEAFDQCVRELLSRRRSEVPDSLVSFMDYARGRGLFAAYREEEEVLYSLEGLGRRLRRPNPLHRVPEIWPWVLAHSTRAFDDIWPQAQSLVADWLKRNSTSTGS
jgi:acyl carrier protein phosphodiesterase